MSLEQLLPLWIRVNNERVVHRSPKLEPDNQMEFSFLARTTLYWGKGSYTFAGDRVSIF